MNKEIFDKAKSLDEHIASLKVKINLLNKLLSCCGLSCEITGTPSQSFTKTNPYKILHPSTIKKLLQDELLSKTTTLEQVQKEFDELGLK